MNRRTILTACITFVIGIMAGVLVMLNDNAYGAINQALNGSTSNAVGKATSNLNGPGNVLEIRNLPWAYTQEDLANAVSELHVEVLTARIAVDRETGRSLGYGFVEVPLEKVQNVIKALNGADLGGRSIIVKVATPRERQRK
ncbi:hypothetical protein O9H85_29185 [Paenibacillus filicis]|uniref:RRM domain-containing protein n=1 Tax=Paenibacillus gyeongsangnamensis TaxID=3388067 RepID=A0ABT4QHQ2_9BACL|nr:hypothetical protein [Paenibacillus filicis]MCZ8516393.1 hypothetical protein [Paenibacillus filicis]